MEGFKNLRFLFLHFLDFLPSLFSFSPYKKLVDKIKVYFILVKSS